MPTDTADRTSSICFWVSEWWGSLGFVCIGFDITKFLFDLIKQRKAAAAVVQDEEHPDIENQQNSMKLLTNLMILYLFVQILDTILTFASAVLWFSIF